jgi:hypothetical protein
VKVVIQQTATDVDQVKVATQQTATDVDQVKVVVQQTATDVDQVKVVMQQTATDVDQVKVATQQTATDVDQVKRLSSSFISAQYRVSPILSGTQLRESIHTWLSPPDPSTNHNIACVTHHKKTASWFFQGSIFREWKSTGSLLWLHGKRLPLPFSYLTHLIRFCIIAGSGKSVLWFVDS